MASSPSSPGHAFPLPKPPRLRIGWITERQWSDLPYEILQLIADGLGIIDLLSFRGVCKDWNSASTTASAKIESSLQLSDPWFLLYGESPECILLSRTGEKYSINIPRLDAGATCIASNNGWLLLLLEQERAVSFFCPFSGAKIDLPNLPEADSITSCIATFSSPPTSPDCIVGVLRQNAALQIELLILHRGGTSWREAKYEDPRGSIKMFRCASYNDGIFNFTHDVKGLLTYNDEQKEWKRFAIVPLGTREKSTESLPFRLGKNFFGLMNTRQRLGLENNVSVSTCGTAVKEEDCDKLIFNECIVAEQGEGSESNRNMKGVWFHPRFFLVPPNHSW